MQGTIKRYFDGKGYGFIQPIVGGVDIFFHVNSVTPMLPGDSVIEPGTRVEFDEDIDARSGKPQAKNVRLV